MTNRLHILWLGWMAVMLALELWSFLPAGREVVGLPLQSLLLSGGRVVPLDGRSLRLDLPAFLRVGEAQVVRFEITSGEQPAGVSIVVASRLELPALAGQPGEVYEKLVSGQPARFAWPVAGEEVGVQRGLLWLTAGVEEEGHPAEQIALLARPLEIQVRSELPLRAAAAAGFALGTAGWIGSRRLKK